MPYQPNPGHLPEACIITETDDAGVEHVTGHRSVHVRLFGGWDSKKAGAAPWPSAGRQPATRWAISRKPHPFEIEEFEIA